jgi:hypothetical protein
MLPVLLVMQVIKKSIKKKQLYHAESHMTLNQRPKLSFNPIPFQITAKIFFRNLGIQFD